MQEVDSEMGILDGQTRPSSKCLYRKTISKIIKEEWKNELSPMLISLMKYL